MDLKNINSLKELIDSKVKIEIDTDSEEYLQMQQLYESLDNEYFVFRIDYDDLKYMNKIIENSFYDNTKYYIDDVSVKAFAVLLSLPLRISNMYESQESINCIIGRNGDMNLSVVSVSISNKKTYFWYGIKKSLYQDFMNYNYYSLQDFYIDMKRLSKTDEITKIYNRLINK